MRAAAAAAGVIRLLTEHRITEFVPKTEALIIILSDKALLSSVVPEMTTGKFVFTTHTVSIDNVLDVENKCKFLKTMDVTTELENPRNSKFKVVSLFLRY